MTGRQIYQKVFGGGAAAAIIGLWFVIGLENAIEARVPLLLAGLAGASLMGLISGWLYQHSAESDWQAERAQIAAEATATIRQMEAQLAETSQRVNKRASELAIKEEEIATYQAQLQTWAKAKSAEAEASVNRAADQVRAAAASVTDAERRRINAMATAKRRQRKIERLEMSL